MTEFKEIAPNLKIAAVDDDFIILEQIKHTFEQIGARVTIFTKGADFLASVEANQYDLVFLDLMMPDLNGFDILVTMQRQYSSPQVIVLSAVTDRETVVRAYRMGVKSYLVKPLKPADILTKTMEILKVNF